MFEIKSFQSTSIYNQVPIHFFIISYMNGDLRLPDIFIFLSRMTKEGKVYVIILVLLQISRKLDKGMILNFKFSYSGLEKF